MKDTFDQVLEVIHRNLTDSGMPTDRAAEVSAQTADRLTREIGGRSVYIPRRPPWFDRIARDRAIMAAFDGRNVSELCRRFGVSRRTVYRLISK